MYPESIWADRALLEELASSGTSPYGAPVRLVNAPLHGLKHFMLGCGGTLTVSSQDVETKIEDAKIDLSSLAPFRFLNVGGKRRVKPGVSIMILIIIFRLQQATDQSFSEDKRSALMEHKHLAILHGAQVLACRRLHSRK